MEYRVRFDLATSLRKSASDIFLANSPTEKAEPQIGSREEDIAYILGKHLAQYRANHTHRTLRTSGQPQFYT